MNYKQGVFPHCRELIDWGIPLIWGVYQGNPLLHPFLSAYLNIHPSSFKLNSWNNYWMLTLELLCWKVTWHKMNLVHLVCYWTCNTPKVLLTCVSVISPHQHSRCALHLEHRCNIHFSGKLQVTIILSSKWLHVNPQTSVSKQRSYKNTTDCWNIVMRKSHIL